MHYIQPAFFLNLCRRRCWRGCRGVIRIASGAEMSSADISKIDELLAQAENEIRKPNWTGAMEIYRQAISIDPNNPLPWMKLGILCRDREIWDEALEQFTRATAASPGYGEAWREKGIVENKIAQNTKEAMDTRSTTNTFRDAVDYALRVTKIFGKASVAHFFCSVTPFSRTNQAGTIGTGVHLFIVRSAPPRTSVIQGNPKTLSRL
jgi:tetratricopeptide (TPR) repeat protein